MQKKLEVLKLNEHEFFRFMREKHPIFFNSNIFLRDIQYSIFTYFDLKGEMLKYSESEKLALLFTEYLMDENKLVKLSNNAWRVDFTMNDFVQTENTNESEVVS